MAYPEGVLVRISVQGIGPGRHVLAESASGSWRLSAFPLNQPEVEFRSSASDLPVARYRRGIHPEVRFEDGAKFQFRAESPVKTVLEAADSLPLLTLEQVEFFPRWRVEMTLERNALGIPQMPILVAAAGLMLVFN